METILPNDDAEMEIRSSKYAQEHEGLTRKHRILIVLAALAALLLCVGMVFLMRGGKPEKETKAIAQANRGLMQAETLRLQKDLLDGKSKRDPLEEDWDRKFQALRKAHSEASLQDSMPDPVPMFRGEAAEAADDPHGVKPGQSSSMIGSVAKSLALMQKGRGSAGAPTGTEDGVPAGFKLSEKMAKEMSEEYQKALAYNASEQLVFTRTRADEGREGNASPSKSERVSPMSSKVIVSAGEELTAVLNESLSSDYPSVAKATLTSPPELSGSTLLLSYALGQERMTAQVLKLILPAKEGERAREQTLAAVVKSGLPGLAGDVSHHWLPQIASGVANAGLTAGALYYAAQNSNKDLGTAVLVAPMIEQSVQGVLKPVNYLGRDRPVTVTVPAGTEFKLLVTDGFEVEL